MYVALTNMRITNTNSKTITIYEIIVRSKYKIHLFRDSIANVMTSYSSI